MNRRTGFERLQNAARAVEWRLRQLGDTLLDDKSRFGALDWAPYGDRARKWLRRLAWQWIAIVIGLTAALMLFAKIGEDVFQQESGSFDAAVRGWVVSHQSLALVRFFVTVTTMGSTIPTIVFAAVSAAWLWRRRGRVIAAAVLTAAAAASGLFVLIKQFFARARPAGAAALLRMLTYSFPSGHATVSAAVLPTLAYVLWRERELSGRWAVTLGAVWPVLVGFSRVYLDVHWATDVLAGWCLGLFAAAIAAAVYQHFHNKRGSRVRSNATIPNPQRVTSAPGDS
jgi:membrane-associated phospholipid phosphatase